MSSSRTFWCGASCVLESEEELLDLALLMMVLLLGIMSSFRWEKGNVLRRKGGYPSFLIITQGGKIHI